MPIRSSPCTWQTTAHYGALAIILSVAAGLRLVFLFQPIRYDEAFTFLFFASRPLSEALADYSLPNNHLFHTLLVHLSYALLGNQPWVLRIPAFISGILLVLSSYFAARALYDRHVGLLTTAFVATSSILVEYSTNARGYTLLCLIFALLLTMSASIKESEEKRQWIYHGLLAAIGFYTIPIMIYPFGVVVAWLGLSICLESGTLARRTRLNGLVVSLATTVLATAVFYLPVFLYSGVRAVVNNRFMAAVSWESFLTKFPPSLLAVWQQWTRDIPVVLSLCLSAGFVAGLCFHRRLSRQRIPVIAGAAFGVLPILLMLRIVGEPRFWLFLLPLFFSVTSAALGHVLTEIGKSETQKTLFISTVSLLLAMSLAWNVLLAQSIRTSEETGTLRDAKAITLFLKPRLNKGDRVVAIAPSDAPLRYYFDLHNVPLVYLDSRNVSPNRLIVVVNLTHRQSLQSVLDRSAAVMGDTIRPYVLGSFKSAILYEIRKIA